VPWTETTPVDQRMRFIVDLKRGLHSMTELCEMYGVSRKTGYKWKKRYEQDGPAGLVDVTRRPDSSPYATPGRVVDALLKARQLHPTWGAKKLLKLLSGKFDDDQLPARSTACDILKRHGMVKTKRRQRKPGHPGKTEPSMTEPNETWTADFKGHFKTRDGAYCYPLTVADGFSRYLLACQSLPSVEWEGTKKVFERVFREYGLPTIIRTDNGSPFASTAIGRLSSLSVWWIRLGIYPELIEPASPQQNGRHERMHLTLKKETTFPPAGNARAQQRRFNRFVREFNEVRPHEALAMETPATRYEPSTRPFPEKIPPLECVFRRK